MTLETLLSKVKRHHHIRSHSKDRHSKHKSIEWELDEPELNPALWKLQSPKFASQEVPHEWLEQYQERQKALTGIRI